MKKYFWLLAVLCCLSLTASDVTPVNWSFRNFSKCPVTWGESPEAFSGKSGVFMKFEPTDGEIAPGRRYTYLFSGDTDGLDGKNAIPAEPGKEYAYSFRIKGHTEVVEVVIFTWNEDTSSKGRVFKMVQRAPVLKEWSCVAGYFKTGPAATRMALGIRCTNGSPGDIIYVDDLIICEKPQIVPAADLPMKIAIYNPGSPEKIGLENIRKCLSESGFQVEMIDTLKPEVINRFPALIVTTTRKLSAGDSGNADTGVRQLDFAEALLNYVHRGGGLILGHDCVGLRGVWEIPVFPQITSGKEISEKRIVSKAAEHPVNAGVPDSFEHSYGDHITITPGSDAEVLLRDADNQAAAVAGKFANSRGKSANGRIVAIGFPLGIGSMPGVGEKTFLLNAVRWCADSPKFTVPSILTEAEFLQDYNKRLAAAERNSAARIEKEIEQYANLPKPHFDEAAAWLFQHRLVNEKQIIQIVENCKSLGFNKIMFQMVSGCNLSYKTELYPQDQVRRAEYDFDDMTAVVEREARRHGMKFGVIVSAYKGWSKNCTMPVEISAIDRQIMEAGRPLPPRRWLCPGNPENQQRLLATCREILTKYQIDEIQFDYVRYSLGYERPCYCDGCLKRKAEFATANPGVDPKNLDREFAAAVLSDLYSRVNAVCKETRPQVITSCYTFAGDRLVFTYPFDRHYRYVSRFLTADWPLSKVRTETERLSRAISQVNPKCQFIPILANCDHINGRRMAAEMALLSQTLDDLKPPVRAFIYYNYIDLARDRQCLSGEMHEEVANAFKTQLKGK